MTTTLPEKHKQELKAHQDTENKSKMYERKEPSKEAESITLGREVSRLKNQHDNWLFDQQMEMIRRELKECINEKQN
jgi:hypothetical protein